MFKEAEKMKIGAAIDGVRRQFKIKKAGEWIQLDPDNRFKFYEQLSIISPHVYIPLTKLALSLVKGIRIEGDKTNLVKNFERWAKKTNLTAKCQGLARLIVRNGTYVAWISETKTFEFMPLIMRYVTLLPENVNPGDFPNYILQPPIKKVCIHEMNNVPRRKIYPREETIYGALFPDDYIFIDNMGRRTYGIYGVSLLEPVTDLIKKYLDLVSSYVAYIKKYGVGRYHIDYKIFEDALKEGRVEEVREVLKELEEDYRNISENDDIIGVGFEIKELDAKGNLNVVEFKESLENDIAVGLLQSPLSMGKTKGSTYAAGYVSESDRMVVLEGLQETIVNIINQEIINRRLEFLNKTPGDVWIEVDKLSKPAVDFRDLIDMAMNGFIDTEEIRIRAGFPPEKPGE